MQSCVMFGRALARKIGKERENYQPLLAIELTIACAALTAAKG